MFDLKVDNNGYAWWYLDAISDDQQYAVTVIAFIGSVFSPYYARARRNGAIKPPSVNPLDYCAINAIIYGKNVARWAMTERSARAVQQSPDRLQIGPSHVSIEGNTLHIHINEVTVPIPRRLRGEISVTLPTTSSGMFDLDTASSDMFSLDRQGKHQWTPIAPRCRVGVNFEHPQMSWQGDGYFDHNRGSEPIEHGFKSWNWSRLNLDNGETMVIYDRVLSNGSTDHLMLTFDSSGTLIDEQRGDVIVCGSELTQATLPVTTLPDTTLPVTSIWRMPRSIRCDQSTKTTLVRTLEDTPFYSRSEVELTLGAIQARGIHESISLTRLVNPLVQLMLPFRMPRRR